MHSELESKEAAFNKIIEWLKENHFGVEVKTRNLDLSSEIQFAANIIYPNKDKIIINITFGKKFKDNFSLGMEFSLDREFATSIQALKDDTKKQQFYRDIRKMAFSMGFHCDTRFPKFSIHKNIFIDSLNSKQFLFDCIFNLIHYPAQVGQ
ncbi:MAG TPA: DUF2299 family protein [Nitrososphaeraceae archaeon]|nr:DUF2299 family protein [Nitrososphaeraceae archaeon]